MDAVVKLDGRKRASAETNRRKAVNPGKKSHSKVKQADLIELAVSLAAQGPEAVREYCRKRFGEQAEDSMQEMM